MAKLAPNLLPPPPSNPPTPPTFVSSNNQSIVSPSGWLTGHSWSPAISTRIEWLIALNLSAAFPTDLRYRYRVLAPMFQFPTKKRRRHRRFDPCRPVRLSSPFGTRPRSHREVRAAPAILQKAVWMSCTGSDWLTRAGTRPLWRVQRPDRAGKRPVAPSLRSGSCQYAHRSRRL